MRSAGESSTVTMSPGAKCATSICDASHDRSSGETSEKTGIAASCLSECNRRSLPSHTLARWL